MNRVLERLIYIISFILILMLFGFILYNYLHPKWEVIQPITKFNILEIFSCMIFIAAFVFMAIMGANPSHIQTYQHPLIIKYITWGGCEIASLSFSLITCAYITLINFMYNVSHLHYIHNEMERYVYKYLRNFIRRHKSISINGKRIKYITMHSKYLRYYLQNHQSHILSNVLNYSSNKDLETSGVFKTLDCGLFAAIICSIIFIFIYLYLDHSQCKRNNVTSLLTEQIIALIPLYLAELSLVDFLLKSVYVTTDIIIVSSAIFITAISINLISSLDKNDEENLGQKHNFTRVSHTLNRILLEIQHDKNYKWLQNLTWEQQRKQNKSQHIKERHLWMGVVAKLLTNDKP